MKLRIPERVRRALGGMVACSNRRMVNTRPLVSFTFDDFPKSALVNGGALLHQHGFQGTYYASCGLMGRVTPTGLIFSPEDIDLLHRQGHELGCHTFSHLHSWDTPSTEFFRDTERNKAQLVSLLGGPPKAFSFPQSCPHPMVKMRLAKSFDSMRSGGQRANHGVVDANSLCGFFVDWRNRNDIDSLLRVIDETCRRNGWLIIATHDIEDEPTQYGISPKLLETLIQHSSRAGATVLPVSAALRMATIPGDDSKS